MLVRRRGEHYKFFCQGCADGNGGVGVLVAEKWVHQMMNINRVNERILVVLLVRKRVVLVISAYAPQVGRSQKVKDAF